MKLFIGSPDAVSEIVADRMMLSRLGNMNKTLAPLCIAWEHRWWPCLLDTAQRAAVSAYLEAD